jgi:hypothetical protein
MKLITSLFLGSAAGLAAVAGAQAADLPMAEPVEYVRICDTYGAGFFYIPGTETCLRVSGLVRAEYLYYDEPDRKHNGRYNTNDFAFRARGRVNFDARTATEYGLLRSYIRYQIDTRSLPSGTGGALLDKAYIQFAGFTGGYNDSMFDFKPYPSYSGMLVSDISTLMAAYTAQFGNGFSATFAVEDKTYRDSSKNLTGFNQVPNINPDPDVPFTTHPMPFNQGGQVVPDIVGNLRVEQGWGEAKLSAAGRRVASGDREEWGWAVQGGVLVNLPMLGENDYVYASGAFGSGALSYIISGQDQGFGAVFNPMTGTPESDYIRNPGSNKIKLTDAWNVNGGFVHRFNPNFRITFSGSYADVDYDGKVLGFNPDWTAGQFAGQLIWTPVRNLDVGFEVDYTQFFDPAQKQFKGGGYTGGGGVVGSNAPTGQKETWGARVRVERSF